ncbi:MAG: photosystem II protein Y [Acaryochloridaceae cyanobacterium RU_4_10]|nr:photosystem II protein Y [Acaryochloridaceae cyanobacterium RU_4_10]
MVSNPAEYRKIKIRVFFNEALREGYRQWIFDFLIVLLPLLLAAGWAARNILPSALRQLDAFMNK